jgi:dTDP-glucose 4,6-dehydratase
LDLVRGEVINIGTGLSLSIAEIARRVVQHMGKPEDLITYVGERPGQVFRHTCDASKAKRILGWEPVVDFARGLEKTAEWYRRERDIWQKQLWMREIPIVTQSGKQELH